MMQPDPDRVTGVLKKWIEPRGFGFLAADGLDDDVFAHIRAFPLGGVTPREGESFTFVVERDDLGRYRAADIRPAGNDAAAQRVFEPVSNRAHEESAATVAL